MQAPFYSKHVGGVKGSSFVKILQKLDKVQDVDEEDKFLYGDSEDEEVSPPRKIKEKPKPEIIKVKPLHRDSKDVVPQPRGIKEEIKPEKIERNRLYSDYEDEISPHRKTKEKQKPEKNERKLQKQKSLVDEVYNDCDDDDANSRSSDSKRDIRRTLDLRKNAPEELYKNPDNPMVPRKIDSSLAEKYYESKKYSHHKSDEYEDRKFIERSKWECDEYDSETKCSPDERKYKDNSERSRKSRRRSRSNNSDSSSENRRRKRSRDYTPERKNKGNLSPQRTRKLEVYYIKKEFDNSPDHRSKKHVKEKEESDQVKSGETFIRSLMDPLQTINQETSKKVQNIAELVSAVGLSSGVSEKLKEKISKNYAKLTPSKIKTLSDLLSKVSGGSSASTSRELQDDLLVRKVSEQSHDEESSFEKDAADKYSDKNIKKEKDVSSERKKKKKRSSSSCEREESPHSKKKSKRETKHGASPSRKSGSPYSSRKIKIKRERSSTDEEEKYSRRRRSRDRSKSRDRDYHRRSREFRPTKRTYGRRSRSSSPGRSERSPYYRKVDARYTPERFRDDNNKRHRYSRDESPYSVKESKYKSRYSPERDTPTRDEKDFRSLVKSGIHPGAPHYSNVSYSIPTQSHPAYNPPYHAIGGTQYSQYQYPQQYQHYPSTYQQYPTTAWPPQYNPQVQPPVTINTSVPAPIYTSANPYKAAEIDTIRASEPQIYGRSLSNLTVIPIVPPEVKVEPKDETAAKQENVIFLEDEAQNEPPGSPIDTTPLTIKERLLIKSTPVMNPDILQQLIRKKEAREKDIEKMEEFLNWSIHKKDTNSIKSRNLTEETLKRTQETLNRLKAQIENQNIVKKLLKRKERMDQMWTNLNTKLEGSKDNMFGNFEERPNYSDYSFTKILSQKKKNDDATESKAPEESLQSQSPVLTKTKPSENEVKDNAVQGKDNAVQTVAPTYVVKVEPLSENDGGEEKPKEVQIASLLSRSKFRFDSNPTKFY